MLKFIGIVQNVLSEQGKTVDVLFKNNIISKNTFYKYKQRNPSLQTLIKVANFIETSIDYMFELCDENKFKKYSNDQTNFYNNLIALIKSTNISVRKFCKDLNYSKDNVKRYKNGTTPSIRTLLEIAEYFKCSVDDLLSHD